MSDEIKLIVYHANEDDPKKCSARKLNRFELAELITNIRKTPRNAILLNPFAEKSISKEDYEIATINGILAVDCSWNNAEASFDFLNSRNNPRSLPFLVAANPVNYGKAFKLTTLEALAASLYVLGFKKQAEKLLNLYKWSPNFLVLNRNPLEDYSNAKNSGEILKIMKQYL